jgi:putative PEP-CTERM system TPR-repeat lipoprotein
MQLAELNLAAKDLTAATQNLKRALELKPDSLTAQQRLVLVSLMSKDYATATRVAQDVQLQQPTKGIGFLLEGDVLAAQQKWESAIATYRKGLKQNGSPELAAKLHATLKARFSRAEADRFAAAWLSSHAKDHVFLEYLGDSAIADKNYVDAVARYRSVLLLKPNHAVAINNLAWASLQLKSPEALKLAERANELAPNQPAFMDTLAWVLADRKEFERAIDVMRRAVALQGPQGLLQLSLAKLLIQAGQKPQAKAELERLSKKGEQFAGHAEVKTLLHAL